MGVWEHTFGKMQYYILDPDKRPVPITLEEYMEFRKKHPDSNRYWQKYRRVGWDEVEGETRISTIFLEIDHRFWETGDPIVFETMTFSPHELLDGLQWRYTSYEAALQGHQIAAAWVEDWYMAAERGLPLPPMPDPPEIEEEPDWTSLSVLAASSEDTPLALSSTTDSSGDEYEMDMDQLQQEHE